MLDLERPDLGSFPRSRALAATGVEALLLPGDVLYMPMSWWHAVHSIGDENISLNFWFYDSGVLFSPERVLWPLTPPSLIELSRHVEYFVAEQLGPAIVGSFMVWWLGDGSGPDDEFLLERWRLMRNYILRRLSRLPRSAGRTVLAMLDPRRWEGHTLRAGKPRALEGLRPEHRVAELLSGLDQLTGTVLRVGMSGMAYRTLGRAIDSLPREKLQLYLECADEVLSLVWMHTNWDGKEADGDAPDPLASAGRYLFSRDEARRMPHAVLGCLEELCDLAAASVVKVATVDNGLFANWLQVLDARFFAAKSACLEPDWVLTGQEKEFNYGSCGDDVFSGLFQKIESRRPQTAAEPFVVRHRFNFMLVNVFRGYFLRGSRATRRRHLYAEAAREALRPNAESLKARDEALASVPRPPGAPLIGVHKRVDNPGTARMQFEQQMASTEAYIRAVREVAAKRGKEAAAIVVLATDDENAVVAFREAFGDRLICRSEAKRCAGGINSNKMPVEVHGQKERLEVKDARDCLVDAMLLAACDAFVHADSNVTIAAGIMNPDAEAVHVRECLPNADNGGAWQGYRRCRLPV
eukprot:gnl/TRDRNA2_/TRDRNA2_165351_c2_seq1.p1 gnl/TRDRNA2_/TRDRNA2_165351_c2~~gnl/TRDRNA2_/TRDRNA2_165351_c2_seq1.p1  ORF type:complete len:581 (+),score=115.61 gnl/TRDRNA2_/TRDRNA2_165351_c2_seq1:1-1743(+)